eukprot:TRINITY_DN9620_c0_g1_i1.p2 TRINITY_DN9620_c0_g1~~TRINITY_DN9620_c0_g1_i1.p2  ORF type:complete len:234 (+),score=83.67 TRINITY_DN9620_c0_g1_i1:1810-2511(+)
MFAVAYLSAFLPSSDQAHTPVAPVQAAPKQAPAQPKASKKTKAKSKPKKMAFEPTEKQIKAAVKEGGKKAQDLAGLSDMGGVKFFHVTMEKCEGEVALVEKAMEGANKVVDEDADDRKGGAGHLGKALFSCNKKQVVVMIHVPEEVSSIMDIDTWSERLMTVLGGEIVKKEPTMYTIVAPGNPEAEKFPVKMRDEAINVGFTLLREKSLVPEDNDSDDDYDYEGAMEENGIEW